jgi:hypothetical protein
MLKTSQARLPDPLELGRDDGLDIRPTLLRALTDLYLQRPVHTPEDESCYTELALRLLDAVDVSERAALAERLAKYSAAPRALVERLAGDVTEVAKPILRHGRRLNPAEPAAQPAKASAAHSPAPLPGESAPRGRSTVAPSEAHELSELFYAASSTERRLILANLAYAVVIPIAPLSSAAPLDICRLVSAILEGGSQAVAQEIERLLGLSRRQAHRIVGDQRGEPILVAAKAINLPADVMACWAAQRSCVPAQPADHVDALAALYEEISADAARRLITIWRSADAGGSDARHPAYVSGYDAIEEMPAGTILHLDDPDVRVEP